MSIKDKVTAYFARFPRLRVLFVFDDDVSLSLTSELEAEEWPAGYRLEIFKDGHWLNTKYAIEHDWKVDKVILVFQQLGLNGESLKDFPLAGLMVANAVYKAEGYEQFMQHNNIPQHFAEIIRLHAEEFDREKFAKILRPYFNEHFEEDAAMRGLLSGYMNDSRLLSWEEIVLKLIIWDGLKDYQKRNEQLFMTLAKKTDVVNALQKYLSSIFGEGISIMSAGKRFKRIAEMMKYNSITQSLPAIERDDYKSLKISDSTCIERLNKLLDASTMLPRQFKSTWDEAYTALSENIHEDRILAVYGADADYHSLSEEMAYAVLKKLVARGLSANAEETLRKLTALRSKFDNADEIMDAIRFAETVSKFYDKLSGLGTLTQNTPDEYISRYTGDLYLFDRWYREAIGYYNSINPDIVCHPELEAAKSRLDKDYAILENKINVEWVRCLKECGNGYEQITSAIRQESFFKTIFDPTRKQAIIICDAFRYELAKQLMESIAQKNGRYICDLTPGLAMLPTETKYCKSALLPHDELVLHDLTLSIDHRILVGTSERAEHLKSHIEEAETLDFETVRSTGKNALRPMFLRPKVTVMYYDKVDSAGHGSTPRDVVAACDSAIVDLSKTILNILNNANVGHVFLTSDHGFLYNDMMFDDQDKISVNDSFIEKKSRYYLTDSGEEIPGITKFPLENVSGMEGLITVAVPTGTNRIMVRGGDYNFAHGGASLQEVIIPILHIYDPHVNTKRPVGVTLISKNLSVVSSRLKITLVQDEAVSQDTKSRTVTVGLYDGDNAVSNIENVLLNSTSESGADRVHDIKLTLKENCRGLLLLKIFDGADPLNPLIQEMVKNNTIIEQDF